MSLPELLKAAKKLVRRADKDGILEYAFKLITENIKSKTMTAAP